MTSHLHLQLFLGSQASRRKFWQHLPWNWEASFDRTYVRFMSWLFGVPPICPEFGGCMVFFNDASIFIDILCAMPRLRSFPGPGCHWRQETPSLAVIRCSKRRFSCAKETSRFSKKAGHGEKYYPPTVACFAPDRIVWMPLADLMVLYNHNLKYGDGMQKSAVKHGSTWTGHDEWPIWHKNYPMILIHFELLKVNCSFGSSI